jgi:hypothetical protein
MGCDFVSTFDLFLDVVVVIPPTAETLLFSASSLEEGGMLSTLN